MQESMAEPIAKLGLFGGGPADTPSNILIVDDRKENLFATEKVLKNMGVNILKASSGNEALSLMLRYKFAVVLLDVQMPEMDGFETAHLMQEDDSMRETPIIFVTAISKEEKYVSRAAEIGAVDYVFKPINSDILKSKVKVYLDLYIKKEQILKLNTVLRQSNDELERFAYICAHDLKSPLRAIDTLSQWIEDDISLQGESKEHMTDLRKRVRRMEKLLDDTLEYARLGQKTRSEENEVISGTMLASDVVGLASAPQGFRIEIGKGFETLSINRLPLQQILYNLVNNAVKHHDKDHGVIKMDVEDRGENYLFSVADDGPGIDPLYHQKIFEMFQTLKPRDQREGSGMGLAIVKKILMTCGGQIIVESAPGKGTTFRFVLPKAPQS